MLVLLVCWGSKYLFSNEQKLLKELKKLEFSRKDRESFTQRWILNDIRLPESIYCKACLANLEAVVILDRTHNQLLKCCRLLSTSNWRYFINLFIFCFTVFNIIIFCLVEGGIVWQHLYFWDHMLMFHTNFWDGWQLKFQI